VEYLAKRRTRYEIYADLIDIVARKGACRLTRASYGANLPVDRAKKSLRFLALRGFVKEEEFEDSKLYKITKRGLEYLETFRQMRRLFAALDENILPTPPTKPPSPMNVAVRLSCPSNEVIAGEDLTILIEVSNIGKKPVAISRIEDAIPPGFEVSAKPNYSQLQGKTLDLKGRMLPQQSMQEIKLTARSYTKGASSLNPKIVIKDDIGRHTMLEPDPITVLVLAGRSSRVGTGYSDLDRLLIGGIPERYAVIFTSISCDEKDLLLRRFLEDGIKNDQKTFYLTIEAASVKDLVERFPSRFCLFICNPQADSLIENAPNVSKLKGVQNLTEINIALRSAFRNLAPSPSKPRRAHIEIISDILLQHGATRTRRWLTGLLPELKSNGFTVTATVNPQMHPPADVQAILDLFEGEITIREKLQKGRTRRYLKINRMYNQRYGEDELLLAKTALEL
jgi:predicted transcriptional regulator/KaiC/GvpD/RAD55 family RecA-like ATPase